MLGCCSRVFIFYEETLTNQLREMLVRIQLWLQEMLMDDTGKTFRESQVGLQVDVHLQQLVHPLPLGVALLKHTHTHTQTAVVKEKKKELCSAHNEPSVNIFFLSNVTQIS